MGTKTQFLQADGVHHDYLYTSKAQRGAPTERTRGARKGVLTWKRVLRWGPLCRRPHYCTWPQCINRPMYKMLCLIHTREYIAAFGEEPPKWADMALRSQGGQVTVRYWESKGKAIVSQVEAPDSFFNGGTKKFRSRGVDALRDKFYEDTGLRLWGLPAALQEARR